MAMAMAFQLSGRADKPLPSVWAPYEFLLEQNLWVDIRKEVALKRKAVQARNYRRAVASKKEAQRVQRRDYMRRYRAPGEKA